MWPLSSFANFAVSWLSKLGSADGNVSTYSLLLSSYANFAVSWLSKAVNWGVPTRMVYLYNEYSREISFWSETLEMQIVMLRTCSFVIRFKTWICRKWCEFRVIISHFFFILSIRYKQRFKCLFIMDVIFQCQVASRWQGKEVLAFSDPYDAVCWRENSSFCW